MANPELGFTGICSDELSRVWLPASRLLAPAMGEGTTLSHVLSALYNQTAQLWIAASETEMHMACVTKIVTRGTRKVCNIWLVGGSGVNNWLHYIETIEAWAKEQGCDAVVMEQARLGWQRLLKNYKPLSMALERKL